MSAYRRFLDFFDLRGRERMDGLDDSHFSPMTAEERERAFAFLLERVERGGSEESVHGLFLAEPDRAVAPVRRLLANGALQPQAQIRAAWHLYRIERDPGLLPVFIRFMSHADAEVRWRAACYVPCDRFTLELKAALQAMIRAETDQLAAIHAVKALLACYDVTEDTFDKATCSRFYRGLRSSDPAARERAFEALDLLY